MRALLLVLLAASPTEPTAPAVPSSPGARWVAVAWREGAADRTSWIDPLTLAELQPDEAGARAVRAVDPAATVKCPRPKVCLWTLTDARAALRVLPPQRFVPVLHDGPSTAAALRVAVGGVVVALDSQAVAAGRERWFAARGLQVLRWLGSDLALVSTGPGMDALELAARLSTEDGVELAVPNWWRPGTTR